MQAPCLHHPPKDGYEGAAQLFRAHLLPGLIVIGAVLSHFQVGHGLLITAQLVQQGNLFEYQVITLGNQLRVLLQEVKTLLMGLVQTFVELVQLHQNATVGLVKVESLLHIFHSLILTVLLVETCQSQITPYSWESGVELS